MSEKILEKKPNMTWYRFARFAGRMFCKLFFKVQFYGMENIPQEGAFLMVSNHQSLLDPLFCGAFIEKPLCFLARDSLFKIRFFGRLVATLNTIPVRRGTADLSAVKAVIARLKKGNSVCLYPEATRTRDGRIAALKPGFRLICRRGNAPVVPVVIDGAFECWPRHKKMFSPGRIVVSYGKVITVEQINTMSDAEFADNLTDILRKMQSACREQQGKEPYNY